MELKDMSNDDIILSMKGMSYRYQTLKDRITGLMDEMDAIDKQYAEASAELKKRKAL